MSRPVRKAAAGIIVTTPGDREIGTERVFDSPRERVWRAFTEAELLARWWGRGNRLAVERLEVRRGGRWRFVEHGPEGIDGFEGRFREVTPQQRIVQTFEWDGMPGHVAVTTTSFKDLGGKRTRVVTNVLFHTKEERDGMLRSGMERGLQESYAALEGVL